MNRNVLIHSIVHQTVVLIAQLATTAGVKTPLARLADQVFLTLVQELKSQGVGQKVIADMFGLALRTYHERVRRLSESATEPGNTLWAAVLGHLQDREGVPRQGLLEHFSQDDEAMVRSVLRDLVDSGLVSKSGRGKTTVFRATDSAEIEASEGADLETLLWVTVHRNEGLTRLELAEMVGVPAEEASGTLDSLVADGRIEIQAEREESTYSCRNLLIPYESAAGWEGALLDHYQAVVGSIVAKLSSGNLRAEKRDQVGGSTYSFDIWPGHPLEGEVTDLLLESRNRATELRTQVDAYNDSMDELPEGVKRVVYYVGRRVPADLQSPVEKIDVDS